MIHYPGMEANRDAAADRDGATETRVRCFEH